MYYSFSSNFRVPSYRMQPHLSPARAYVSFFLLSDYDYNELPLL